jgi:hypothetical protein
VGPTKHVRHCRHSSVWCKVVCVFHVQSEIRMYGSVSGSIACTCNVRRIVNIVIRKSISIVDPT